MGDLAAYKVHEVAEYRTRPSSSVRTFLQEFLYLLHGGAMLLEKGYKWNFHETVGGIKLDPKHTEIMDGLAIETAAGFVPEPKISPDEKQDYESGKISLVEIRAKTSSDDGLDSHDGRAYYYPFFKRRRLSRDGVIAYPGYDKPRSLVEFRMFPCAGDDFIILVRQANFHWQFATGVSAYQIEEQRRTPEQKALVEAYLTLINDWQALLKRHNIDNLPEEKKFLIFNSVSEFDDYRKKPLGERTTPYGKFISKLMVKSQYDDKFRQEVRRLTNTYSKRVKEILGL
jgi:hypothetical protein